MTSHRTEPERNDQTSFPLLPLDSARMSFGLLVAGPQPLSVQGRSFAGLPNRRIPLDELRDLLMHRRCPRRTRDAVWSHLVRRSRREGAAWTLACTGMALPALRGVARWLGARYPGDPFDVHAEVLSGFLAGIASVDLKRPQVLPRLRWAAYRQGHAALTEALDAPAPVAAGFRSTVPRVPWGHPDLVLARAVRAAVLSQSEADLIGATRLEEESVADWADRNTTTLGAAYKARRRAERRLVAFLRDQARETDPDDPVAELALDRLPSVDPQPCNDRSTTSDAAPPVAVGRGRASRVRAEEVGRGVSKSGSDFGLGKRGGTSPAPNRPLSLEGH